MRAATVFLACLSAAVPARAQDTVIVIHPDSARAAGLRPELPRAVAEGAISFHNAATTARLVGRTRLPAAAAWRGDVAVRNGPLVVAGRIEGSVLLVNGDLRLEPGAEITGDVTVVGGTVTGAAEARLGGVVRVFRQRLSYRLDGEHLVYAPTLRSRLSGLGASASWGDERSRSTLTIATAGTFNRVEGLPVVFGPRFEWRLSRRAELRVDAVGVLRSAGDLSDSRSDLGYQVRTDVHSTGPRRVGLGLRAYDLVAPVEDWGLGGSEVGWAAFLFHRDYRDYYLNKGAGVRLFARPEHQLELALEARREWQTSVATRDPWTVLRNEQAWRPNPPVDDGHYVTLAGTLTLDTRNDRDDPTTGWYVSLTVAQSHSHDVAPQAAVPASVREPLPTDGSYAFRNGFLDVRRYTRVSPAGRVNLRLVAGGWLGGDPLPLQQRLSLGGPDPMPGYPFRHSGCHRDLADPELAAARVAACDRLLLVQAEYRGHIRFNWTYPARGRDDESAGPLFRLEGPDLVVFADAGQAWLVGNGPGRVPSDRLPTLGSWLADVGLGMDWGGLGFYAAKAVTVGHPLRFTLRLDHRF